MKDYLEQEELDVRRLFNLEEFIQFSNKYLIMITPEADCQYHCYIHDGVYATGLTFMGALVYGMKVFQDAQKES